MISQMDCVKKGSVSVSTKNIIAEIKEDKNVNFHYLSSKQNPVNVGTQLTKGWKAKRRQIMVTRTWMVKIVNTWIWKFEISKDDNSKFQSKLKHINKVEISHTNEKC